MRKFNNKEAQLNLQLFNRQSLFNPSFNNSLLLRTTIKSQLKIKKCKESNKKKDLEDSPELETTETEMVTGNTETETTTLMVKESTSQSMNQREESNKNHKDNHHQMMINKFNPQ